MARWLVKEEPSHYSWSDLVRDGTTEWDGVHNALALRHLKSMAPGDEAIVYHTGDERRCVGIARVAGAPHPDPSDDRGSWSVLLRAVRPLRRPVGLAELKADSSLASFPLVRFGRLSVLPVSDREWSRVLWYESRPSPEAPATRAPRRAAPATRRRATARAARRRS